jgi:hypothetical protein
MSFSKYHQVDLNPLGIADGKKEKSPLIRLEKDGDKLVQQ